MEEKIYVVVSRTSTRVGKFLRLFSSYPYNHVSVTLDQELTQLYSFGRWYLYLPFIGGFVHEDLEKGVLKIHNNIESQVYCVALTSEQYQQMQQTLDKFLQDPRHFRYNLLGLLLARMNIPWRRNHHFICSQFVAYLLEECSAVQLLKDYSIMLPEDFARLEELELVYAGQLKDFKSLRVS